MFTILNTCFTETIAAIVKVDRSKPSESPLSKEILVALKKCITDRKSDSLSYYAHLQRRLPTSMKIGIIPRSFLLHLIPEYQRFDLELGPHAFKRSIELFKTHRDKPIRKMTAERYFGYCQLAYLANPNSHEIAKHPKASGKELYQQFADSRDAGLLKVNLKSERAFARWNDCKERETGHPWRIYQGGSSTGINLQVARADSGEGWKLYLSSSSSSRLSEVCRITLALNKAGVPFYLLDQESYLNRLLRQDWIGILPESTYLKYGWHHFPREYGVSDCLHFSWFKDDYGKTALPLHKIKRLITWLPIMEPPV